MRGSSGRVCCSVLFPLLVLFLRSLESANADGPRAGGESARTDSSPAPESATLASAAASCSPAAFPSEVHLSDAAISGALLFHGGEAVVCVSQLHTETIASVGEGDR